MKAASPVRLQSELMEAARLVGEQEHRSASEQVEHWAALGRKISTSLIEVEAGIAQVKVERITGQPIDPDAVFTAVESARSSGTLPREVTTAETTYQAAIGHPGYLERIEKNGTRTIGSFQGGRFVSRGERR